MAQFEKTFKNGSKTYRVTLDNDMGDGATGCWIEYRTKARIYSASLQCAQGIGELESNDGYAHEIEPAFLDDIEEWAIENGY